MSDSSPDRSRVPLTVLLVIVGALLLFGNFNIFRLGWIFDFITRFWPSLFIISGIVRIAKRNTRLFSGGLQDFLIGIVLQLIFLGWLPGSAAQYWPVAFIVIGLWLLFIQPRNVSVEREITGPDIRITETLRGSRIILHDICFETGSISATMSLVHCTMKDCKAGMRFMRLSCSLRGSGVILFVPESWSVSTEMRTTLARITDRRVLGNPPEGGNAPELILQGNAFLSTVEIRDAENWVYEEEGEKEEDG
ncbi:MAG: hypothetical protein JXA28_08705 [Bacteroidetes bacterium]|nr:hypothetical protein [Bacteroidota bacterium]